MALTRKHIIRQTLIEYQQPGGAVVRCNVLRQFLDGDTVSDQTAAEEQFTDTELEQLAAPSPFWGEPQVLAALQARYPGELVAYFEPPKEA